MKSSCYMTRALRSKDGRYAVLLGKLGHSVPLQPRVSETDLPVGDGTGREVAPASVSSDDEIKSLRSQYETVLGKRAFAGWDAETLRQKIAQAEANG